MRTSQLLLSLLGAAVFFQACSSDEEKSSTKSELLPVTSVVSGYFDEFYGNFDIQAMAGRLLAENLRSYDLFASQLTEELSFNLLINLYNGCPYSETWADDNADDENFLETDEEWEESYQGDHRSSRSHCGEGFTLVMNLEVKDGPERLYESNRKVHFKSSSKLYVRNRLNWAIQSMLAQAMDNDGLYEHIFETPYY